MVRYSNSKCFIRYSDRPIASKDWIRLVIFLASPLKFIIRVCNCLHCRLTLQFTRSCIREQLVSRKFWYHLTFILSVYKRILYSVSWNSRQWALRKKYYESRGNSTKCRVETGRWVSEWVKRKIAVYCSPCARKDERSSTITALF